MIAIDWSEAPGWATHHAISLDGSGYWYPSKPEISPVGWVNTHGTIYVELSGYIGNGINWSESLVERPKQKISFDISRTLEERGSRYGKFKDLAVINQDLNDVLKSAPNWGNLEPHQKLALEMVTHKISRILNGDPSYDDNWIDIAGYAELGRNPDQ